MKHNSAPRHPFATLMAYGPDNTRATKLVVGIFKTPASREADELHRWFINEGDVRNEPCPCGSGKKFKKCCGKGHVALNSRT